MAKTIAGHQVRWFLCAVTVLLSHTAGWAQMPAASSSSTPPGNDRPATTAAKAADGSLLQPGEYMTEKGWGYLQLDRQGKELTFSIESVVSEDGCTLSGKIKDGRGIAADAVGPSACTVNFTNSKQGIGVSTSTPTECKRFCGHNGGFEAVYSKVQSGCSLDEIQRTRDAFKKLYDNKNYKPALEKLSPVLTNCLPTLRWEEEGRIRNDLAITLYKNGLYDQCLVTLEKYAEDAKKDDDAVMEGWTAGLAGSYLSIVKAARTNIALCSKKSMKK